MTYIPGSVATDADFNVGNVFERSFSILLRNFIPLILLGGIAAVPYLLIFYFQGDTMFAPTPGKLNFSPTAAIAYFASLLAAFVLRPIAQAMILFGAFQDMRGLQFPVGESLRKGLARFFPIIAMLIVEGLGLLVGFILLFFPGYILFTAWYLALPALVVERLGPVTALRRSAALTKGHRWKIFGVIFVMGLVAGIIGAVVSGIVLASHNKLVFVGLQYLFQSVYVAFQSVVGVVLYHDLRAAKEGLDTDRIAAVFD